MTFAEARKKYIEKLDTALTELRNLAIDPELCNVACRELNTAIGNVNDVIHSLARLNSADMEANRD